MQSVVVNVAEDGAGTDTVRAILGVDELAETVHDHSAVLPLALLLVLLGLTQHTQTHITLTDKLPMRSSMDIRRILYKLYSLGNFVPHLGLSLDAQAAPVSLVVELVISVHDPAEIDAADLLCAALVLQVSEQPVHDATDSSLVLQVVDVFWRKSGKRNSELLGRADQSFCLQTISWCSSPCEWGSVFCMILVNSSSILSTSVNTHPRTLNG